MGEIKDPYEAIRRLKRKFREQEGDIFERDVGILTASGPKQPAGKRVSPALIKPAGKVSPIKKAGKKKAPVPKKKKKR